MIFKPHAYNDPHSTLQGTHVLVLPSDTYSKEYWNKMGYLSVTSDNRYYLTDTSIYCTDAKEDIHFEWLENMTLYDGNGTVIN